MTLSAGTRLGPFRVDRLLASGGSADVYRALDTRLNRQVALKVLAPGVPIDADRLARFAQEARTTALLNHPNVVSLYEVGLHEGVPYVVSELLHGMTLRERLTDGPLPFRVTLGYTLEIVRGLVAAHDIGIVHRDLKPENIFITREDNVKILDFGLAKCRRDTLGLPHEDSSNSTQPGVILGTVGYMAPEQVRGTPADQRSDIFSVGVMLHEMVTGAAPFRRGCAIETLHATLKEEPPPLPERCLCSQELRSLVRHCLEKNPSDRFQSSRDLLFVLDFILEFGGRATAPPPAPVPVPVPDDAKTIAGLLQSIFSLF